MTKEGKPLSAADRIITWGKDTSEREALEKAKRRAAGGIKRARMEEFEKEYEKRERIFKEIDEKLGITSSLEDINKRVLSRSGTIEWTPFNIERLPEEGYVEIILSWGYIYRRGTYRRGTEEFEGGTKAFEVEIGHKIRVEISKGGKELFVSGGAIAKGDASGDKFWRELDLSDPKIQEKFQATLSEAFRSSEWRRASGWY